ncbi:error-prone DNA polymerase [Yunchengibacter salinarum]|uniref:error-prone DNA polymerase n=1 Tax=Yunchengibacter salinarum TaxID=3133399 RepID=UPI0035B5E752
MSKALPPYSELMAVSAFSFLRSAAQPEELVQVAHRLGLGGLAVTDRNSMAGLVRAHQAAKEAGLAFMPGVWLALADGVDLLAYPTDRAAYGRLTGLITTGYGRGGEHGAAGECILYLGDVAAAAEGQVFALLATDGLDVATLNQIREKLDAPLYLGLRVFHDGADQTRLAGWAALAGKAGVPVVALGDVRLPAIGRKPLLDVMTCIRHHTTLDAAGYRLARNGEAMLKRPEEMARLFAAVPEAVTNTRRIVRRCRFSLDSLAHDYPDEPVAPGETPQSQLEKNTWAGAEARFPDGIPRRVRAMLERELALIGEMGYAPYFLTVHDIVNFARSREILCQGRGSAANSITCYCLGITAVNPAEIDLLFERFISKERDEPPDIDVDFEHERREEVIQYIYARYGRHRAALAATVIRYKARSALREVGKVMGLSADVVGALAGTVWGSRDAVPEETLAQAGLASDDPRIRQTLALAQELIGFPRHLSQHVGGFVLTQSPLSDVVPIRPAAMDGRTMVEWDKDDLDALGILKIDVLALGMLTCLRKGFDLLAGHHGKPLTLASLPREDPVTYAMLSRGDSLGVFQVESRAQMAMLPRMRPRTFYDLVIEVAIVRPGPIQGDMVHPYLRRRNGAEAIEFPAPDPAFGEADELKDVLGRTLGVPLFQEQAMKIAMVAAGFTGGEADRLRRAMAAFRKTGRIAGFRDKFITGMTARGYDPAFAERCFSQIEGFGEYGFPESHAASFALLVYASAWMKGHYPAAFCCALLNSQPMGFYAPAQIVRDAREHGVTIRPVDVRHSRYDSTLESDTTSHGGRTVRLGLRQIKGLGAEVAEALAAAPKGAFADMGALHRATGLSRAVLEKLAAADAFRSMGLGRREALWQVKGLVDAPDLPLFTANTAEATGHEPGVSLPAMAEAEQVVDDYQTLRLSLRAHPLSFLRDRLTADAVTPAAGLAALGDGARVTVAGLVLVRQKPGSARGVTFVTLEDETGVVNAVIWKDLFKAHRAEVMGSRLMAITGKVQKSDGVTHVIAKRITDRSSLLMTLSNAPDTSTPGPHQPATHPRDTRDLVPKAREFK